MHWAYIINILKSLVGPNCLGRPIGHDNVWAKIYLGAMLDPQFKEGVF